tara:strand:+ start:4194 stop:4493 length:300 start_codon:yes stop_codon:yes gene_type:complete
MKVELLPHKGINMATRQEETVRQYRVVLDGKLVGYKSWDFGSKVIFITKLSPEDIAEVKNQVEHLLGDTADHVNAPDEEKILAKYEDNSDDEVHHDDFN